jgi:hypothetical protein
VSPRRSRAAGHRHLKPGAQELRLDREVLDLLRHDPELLAIADAVAATQLFDADAGLSGTRAEHKLRTQSGRRPRNGVPPSNAEDGNRVKGT